MSDAIQAYPLTWPARWPRAVTRERSKFKTTFDAARRELFRELKLMGVPDWNIILSTNLPLRGDGLPYATAKSGPDTGVAVYFKKENEEKRYVFACDRWDRIEDNMRAIQHSIAAIRGIERWGASDMIERAFTGFTAIPAPESQEPWWSILDWRERPSKSASALNTAEFVYRTKSKKAHPDVPGGSNEAMSRLNRAIEQARAELG